MLVAMATAVHWLEGVLVPLFPGLPGVKLGLANLFTLYALQTLGRSSAFLCFAVWARPAADWRAGGDVVCVCRGYAKLCRHGADASA